MSVRELLQEELRTVRELRALQIQFDPIKCKGTWQCYEVCPIGLWKPNREERIVGFEGPEGCVACGACVLQCPEDAILLTVC
jgi:NAD-dependent dihydropyrimidine dehydrogenase PreA subunit